MTIRRMELLLDDDDFNAIQRELAHRQVRHRVGGGEADTLLPEGESNIAGGLLAECIRDLDDYRAMFRASRSADALLAALRAIVDFQHDPESAVEPYAQIATFALWTASVALASVETQP